MIAIFIIFACVWICLSFLDYMFKSCMFFPYLHFLGSAGITVKPFTISLYITRFNRIFHKLSWYKPHFIRRWFFVGTVITCLVLVPALGLLIKTAVNVIFIKDIAQIDQQLLQPVVPGVNLPVSHLLYYFLALLFCSIVHEMGHALAAAREGVQVQGCGIFLLGIIPGAYVDLPGEQLQVLSKWQQLSIFCAGIWHNIALVFLCALLLFLNPLILSPLFELNSGVSVIDVAAKSSLGESSGLSPRDQIYDINGCVVKDIGSWNECNTLFSKTPQPGYCASETLILSELSDVVGTDTCVNDTENLPFHYMLSGTKKYSCLPGRKLLDTAQLCNTSHHCLNHSDVCVTPVLPDAFRIFQIKRRNSNSVLFIGTHIEILQHITVSPYVSKSRLLSTRVVFTYEMLLKYIASFSGALAVLNVIPCPKLDGQWLCGILVELLFSPFVPQNSHRRLISQGLMTCGCFLITVTIIAGVYQLLQY